MDANAQSIIDMLSKEISKALKQCEHHRHESGDMDKIEAYMTNYTKRVELLRNIRTQLENEFIIIHYDPR